MTLYSWVQLFWITSYISHRNLPSPDNGPLGVIKGISGKEALPLLLLNDSRKLWTNMFDTLTTTVLPDRNRSNQPLAALGCVSSIQCFGNFSHLHCSTWHVTGNPSACVSYNLTCGCPPFLGPIKHFVVAFQENMQLQSFLQRRIFASLLSNVFMPHCSASMLVCIHSFISVLNHSEIF